MRIVMFRGAAVKRQRKIDDNKILLVFYSRPPLVVTPDEWEAERISKFFAGDVRRRDIVRSIDLVG